MIGMAKKPTTPRPPRPGPAPKRRDGKGPRAGGSSFSSVPRWTWVLGAAVLIGVVVVGAVFAFGGGSSSNSTSDVKATMLAAGCTYRDVEPLKPTHATGGFHADVPDARARPR